MKQLWMYHKMHGDFRDDGGGTVIIVAVVVARHE